MGCAYSYARRGENARISQKLRALSDVCSRVSHIYLSAQCIVTQAVKIHRNLLEVEMCQMGCFEIAITQGLLGLGRTKEDNNAVDYVMISMIAEVAKVTLSRRSFGSSYIFESIQLR